ncbi:MAG: polysulfide reductase NrfD [Chromatiales bacterium]|jgi:molybdopterin-containing oxidoreductase family membrane subunit|nr:polysulfide reductase NrfD [Chromatiales bacterium]
MNNLNTNAALTPEQEKDINEDIRWAKINEDVLHSMESPRGAYWLSIIVCLALLSLAVIAEIHQYLYGLGEANLNWPHMWGLYIATFIFWIGMSHSGTLLSAILHIIHADWRKPIYRFAEAMTTFTLLTAMLFPVIHLGRVWNMYWVLPYFSDRGIWPNFRSPLLWDAFAISTYLTSSALFLFMGSIPDLAIVRDSARGWRKKLYAVLALGWRGDDRQWRNFRVAYLVLACFLIPLAVSVHSIVASDFAMSIMPGWHITSFPPYFVAGALYSGCAGIITLFVLLRYFFRFEAYMTIPILEKTCKLTFAIGMVWTYLTFIEFASVWYGHNAVDKELLLSKFSGPYSIWFWQMLFCGSVLPFMLAVERFRRSIPIMFVVSILLNYGMWLERWMIVAPTLSQGYEPFAFHVIFPSWVQWFIVAGSFGWFGLLFLIFVKVIPSVSMYEVKEMIYHRRHLAHKDLSTVMHSRSASAGGNAAAAADPRRTPGTPGLEGA